MLFLEIKIWELITPSANSLVWNVSSYGGNYTNPNYYMRLGVSPTIHLSSQVKITKGTGLPDSPFEISL